MIKTILLDLIIGLDQKIVQTLNHGGSNGEAYVNHLRDRSELYLVIRVRQWDEQHVHE